MPAYKVMFHRRGLHGDGAAAGLVVRHDETAFGLYSVSGGDLGEFAPQSGRQLRTIELRPVEGCLGPGNNMSRFTSGEDASGTARQLRSGPSQRYVDEPACRLLQISTGPKEQFMSARLFDAAPARSRMK